MIHSPHMYTHSQEHCRYRHPVTHLHVSTPVSASLHRAHFLLEQTPPLPFPSLQLSPPDVLPYRFSSRKQYLVEAVGRVRLEEFLWKKYIVVSLAGSSVAHLVWRTYSTPPAIDVGKRTLLEGMNDVRMLPVSAHVFGRRRGGRKLTEKT